MVPLSGKVRDRANGHKVLYILRLDSNVEVKPPSLPISGDGGAKSLFSKSSGQ